jgi:glc operon protein GlcG
MSPHLAHTFAALIGVLASVSALAQTPLPPSPPYGPTISLENARKAAEAAIVEARKNNWTMAAAVVDPAGTLVYYEKMDNTQNASAKIAIDKARSAALFKRPTKVLADRLASGGLGVLKLEEAMPVEGGIPLVVDGKVVGAIGLSGDSAEHDGQCAQAGADSLK